MFRIFPLRTALLLPPPTSQVKVDPLRGIRAVIYFTLHYAKIKKAFKMC